MAHFIMGNIINFIIVGRELWNEEIRVPELVLWVSRSQLSWELVFNWSQMKQPEVEKGAKLFKARTQNKINYNFES